MEQQEQHRTLTFNANRISLSLISGRLEQMADRIRNFANLYNDYYNPQEIRRFADEIDRIRGKHLSNVHQSDLAAAFTEILAARRRYGGQAFCDPEAVSNRSGSFPHDERGFRRMRTEIDEILAEISGGVLSHAAVVE